MTTLFLHYSSILISDIKCIIFLFISFILMVCAVWYSCFFIHSFTQIISQTVWNIFLILHFVRCLACSLKPHHSSPNSQRLPRPPSLLLPNVCLGCYWVGGEFVLLIPALLEPCMPSPVCLDIYAAALSGGANPGIITQLFNSQHGQTYPKHLEHLHAQTPPPTLWRLEHC